MHLLMCTTDQLTYSYAFKVNVSDLNKEKLKLQCFLGEYINFTCTMGMSERVLMNRQLQYLYSKHHKCVMNYYSDKVFQMSDPTAYTCVECTIILGSGKYPLDLGGFCLCSPVSLRSRERWLYLSSCMVPGSCSQYESGSTWFVGKQGTLESLPWWKQVKVYVVTSHIAWQVTVNEVQEGTPQTVTFTAICFMRNKTLFLLILLPLHLTIIILSRLSAAWYVWAIQSSTMSALNCFHFKA